MWCTRDAHVETRLLKCAMEMFVFTIFRYVPHIFYHALSLCFQLLSEKWDWLLKMFLQMHELLEQLAVSWFAPQNHAIYEINIRSLIQMLNTNVLSSGKDLNIILCTSDFATIQIHDKSPQLMFPWEGATPFTQRRWREANFSDRISDMHLNTTDGKS